MLYHILLARLISCNVDEIVNSCVGMFRADPYPTASVYAVHTVTVTGTPG